MYRCIPMMLLACLFAGPVRAGDDIKICVVAVLATDKDKVVDERLVDFAKQVQLKKPELTGFKVGHSSSESIPMGQTKKFLLVDKQVVEVTVNATTDEQGRVVLTIKPPNLNQITYTCICGRYFTMATQHFTKDKEQLFIAIMAKPCMAPAPPPPPAKKP